MTKPSNEEAAVAAFAALLNPPPVVDVDTPARRKLTNYVPREGNIPVRQPVSPADEFARLLSESLGHAQITMY